VAEWARLLSECRVKPVAGSNPALSARKHSLCFCFVRRASIEEIFQIPPSPLENALGFECVFVLSARVPH
jgi:hypothetical protein